MFHIAYGFGSLLVADVDSLPGQLADDEEDSDVEQAFQVILPGQFEALVSGDAGVSSGAYKGLFISKITLNLSNKLNTYVICSCRGSIWKCRNPQCISASRRCTPSKCFPASSLGG